MMAERGDYFVLHEPFSHVADFGSAIVGDRVVYREDELIAALRDLATRTTVFFKDTTDFRYPGVLADQAFLADATHTFLIRHPAETIPSHFALNPNLGRDDIGFGRLADIYEAVVRRTGAAPVVVDSADLIANPAATIQEYCRRVGISFLPKALSWQPGMCDEWRKTGEWHEATSRTRTFSATTPAYRNTVHNNPVLAEYLDYHLPYYRKLRRHRMVVNGA
jgi:hypothetical protein